MYIYIVTNGIIDLVKSVIICQAVPNQESLFIYDNLRTRTERDEKISRLFDGHAMARRDPRISVLFVFVMVNLDWSIQLTLFAHAIK